MEPGFIHTKRVIHGEVDGVFGAFDEVGGVVRREAAAEHGGGFAKRFGEARAGASGGHGAAR